MTTLDTPSLALTVSQYKFVEVYGSDFRSSIKDMADTTTRLNLWTWFREESPPDDTGYMWWGHENIHKISNGLKDNQHSGATFAFCMRVMQAIAKQGFTPWNTVKKVVNTCVTVSN